MTKTAFVTCYYIGLYGTKFGGRNGLDGRYRDSFSSLLKLSNADWYVFCEEKDVTVLQEISNSHPETKVTLIPQSLENHYFQDLFDKYKDYEAAKESDRCLEVQYLKTHWLQSICNDYDYDTAYWIDIGISHSGLFPDKFMIQNPETVHKECFNVNLFRPEFVDGLNELTGDKFFIIEKSNNNYFCYRNLIPLKHFNDRYKETYRDSNDSNHCIGGLLGGKKEVINWFHNKFMDYAAMIAEEDKEIYEEESIYHVLRILYDDKFKVLYFENWYHENNIEGSLSGDEARDTAFKNSKSFHKTFEEILEAGMKQ